MQSLNTAPPAVQTAGTDERLQRLLAWLGDLIQSNGAGEYIVTVAADGHVMVKRPRKPLEFHYGG